MALLAVVMAAGPNPMIPFPQNFRQTLIKYAVVDRVDKKSRDLYISKRGLEAIQQGLPLPVGTVIAIETFSGINFDTDGKISRSKEENQLHVVTKLQPGEGLRVWGFGAYLLDGKPESVVVEMPGNCLACHQEAVKTDLVISMDLLKKFASTGQVQFSRCALPGREICESK
ncbi:MAG: cytochrome P460 family protein [Meiothermus sp.]|nr:cytochrome P460 family protein [Meiothermus sp.]